MCSYLFLFTLPYLFLQGDFVLKVEPPQGWSFGKYYTLSVLPREIVSFVFPRVDGKQNSLFSEGVHIKCFVIWQGKKNQQHFYDNCISRYHDNKSKIL